MSDYATVHWSDTVAPVFHLVVPGLDGITPAVLAAGHVQVLPTAAGCSERERSFRSVIFSVWYSELLTRSEMGHAVWGHFKNYSWFFWSFQCCVSWSRCQPISERWLQLPRSSSAENRPQRSISKSRPSFLISMWTRKIKFCPMKCYHLQHVAGSRLNSSSQSIVFVHNFTLFSGRDQDGPFKENVY